MKSSGICSGRDFETMNYYVGVDIGGTKTAFGFFDQNRSLLSREQTPSDPALDGPAFFAGIAERIAAYRAEARARGGALAGAGIGITGFVDFESGTLSKSPSLPKLSGFPAARFLRERLGPDLPVALDNDCHCGALAEYRRGAGRGKRHMLYCPVSTGISTGIIIDGKLFRGSNGASGESGHALADPPAPLSLPCSCGNAGCYNSLASGKAITEHVRRWLEEGEDSILPELAGGAEHITARHIGEAYDLGDPLARRAVEQMVHYLALWIFNVYMLLNIDCIVFSGGLLAMGEKLLGRVEAEFERYHTNGFPVSFHRTELGEDSGLRGAVELLFDA